MVCKPDVVIAVKQRHNHVLFCHDDVIKWKRFPRYWSFVWGIHRSPVNSPHKGQWRGALMFFFICARLNAWVNNREAGDLRRHRAHYVVIVIRGPSRPPPLVSCQYFWFMIFPWPITQMFYHKGQAIDTCLHCCIYDVIYIQWATYTRKNKC